MYNIIPVIIILLSLAVIAVILIRKLPHLSGLDVESIPEAKAKETKRKILDERLKRKLMGLGKKFQPSVSGISSKITGSFAKLRMKLENTRHQLEKSQVPKRAITKAEVAKKQEYIEETLEQAQELAHEDNFEIAEKRFIDVISQDPSNVEAYQGLADLYVEKGKLPEAIETLRYLKKLQPESIKVLIELAELYEKTGNLAKALSTMIRAAEIEPRNPKVLDFTLELSIKNKQKETAQNYLQQLAEVNPENQKLEDLQKTVDGL